MVRHLVVALLLVFALPLAAQTTRNTCVEVSATVQASPPQITFSWPADATATGYNIYRRARGATSWGSAIVTLAAGATGWSDSAVSVGVAYEYRFDKSGNPAGRGYCQAGIELPAVHSRGKVILLVADTHATYLATEIARLEQDLIGDGWTVLRRNVASGATAATVKATIVADYNADPANVKALFILGAVPVPYSGNTAWDGHSDHQGAWPCDGYYADINGTWTDTTVNNTTPARAENDNTPGDGKFDQSTFPSTLELAAGRVDLSNMPAFTTGEADLLKNYLNKNHDFRHKVITCAEQAVIDDNFSYTTYTEAFAASGWRNFAPMFGAANTVAGDYFTTLNTASGPGYLWSYGCGGGTYTSAGGVGSTTTFTTSTNRNIFTMLFGSYHGDWHAQNNFMRASLCSGWTLTCAWAGRPAWSFWHMALGETTGHSALWSMNDPSPLNGAGARGCHMALMGDPTLRMHVMAPVSGLNGAVNAGAIDLTWAASPDASGYHVYRASASTGPYTLLNAAPVSVTTLTDSSPLVGDNFYMVRAVALKTSSSGSYYNLSQGLFVTVNNPLTAPVISSHPGHQSVTEGQTATFNVTAAGAGTLSYQWQRNGVDIPGATSASYTTPATTLAESGDTLRCVVTNAGGSTPSNTATLTVNPAGTSGGGGGGGDGGCSTEAHPGLFWLWAAAGALGLLLRRRGRGGHGRCQSVPVANLYEFTARLFKTS